MEYISQFTTDIRHICGPSKRSNGLDFSNRREEHNTAFDVSALAEAQVNDNELENHRSNSSLELRSVLVDPDVEKFCEVSTSKIRPYIHKQFRRDIYLFLKTLQKSINGTIFRFNSKCVNIALYLNHQVM